MKRDREGSGGGGGRVGRARARDSKGGKGAPGPRRPNENLRILYRCDGVRRVVTVRQLVTAFV